ncbi:SAF domain-containing protein [Nocardioides sp. NPDC057764]|uniref:SAF domain-containing protein n=1 Tax=Nocardioides sp. NPDC057764 TaxID=3346243 RepID=UPI00366B5819
MSTATKQKTNGQSLLSGERRPGQPQKVVRGRRQNGLAIAAGLLVLVLALAGAAWGMTAGDKASVLAVGKPVAKGHTISREDLVSTAVAGPKATIPVEDVNSVVGKTAAVDLVEGQILTEAMVTSDPVPAEGESLIGLALDPARVPGSGLAAGDSVDIVAVPAAEQAQADAEALDSPTVLADAAQVYDVAGAATSGGQVLVTVVVDDSDSARIAAYSTANRVAVVETAASSSGDEG